MDSEPIAGRSLLRDTFRLDTRAGRAASVGAALFVITPSLAFFGPAWWLFLLVPAIAFSLLGLSGSSEVRSGRGKLAATGTVLAVNGTVLILALFVLGFLGDFVLSSEQGLRSNTVGVGFTTVHVLLGLGLLLVDHYRHRSQ